MKICFGYYLLFFLCFYSLGSNGQGLKNFTTDPVKFVEELQKFLGETNKKDGEKLMESFKLSWNSGKFTSPQQDEIYRTANAM